MRKPKIHRIHDRNYNRSFGLLEKIKEETEEDKTSEGSRRENFTINIDELSNSNSYNKNLKRCGISIRFKRSTEAEHIAAGWPTWLSSVAGEAIHGWLPLKPENFERLEKIGQGTYSNVYRARNLQSGKMMAIKKVRFDNYQPESVRFMAREIKILRRLDHPNVMKLEGIITSKLSCSIYLVFEYMEHDLNGLLSSPDVKFTDSQIKCYMWQLLKGMEHCHSRGVLHRDIKSSNILVNNEGVLKIADFGLANFCNSRSREPQTNRVVTLWYRPPELLLGSTNYGTYVDMWSVGCVFAELYVGRPILKGRTEVEQLHKIFKLCGTPPDEYWKRSRLPLAAMFRPQYAYESTLRERCKELPRTTVDLITTLLSVEPEKRVTARSALQAEYFYTKPYPCDPASMPTYPPNKEMDSKSREAARRKKGDSKVRLIPEDNNPYLRRIREDAIDSKASYETVIKVSGTTEASQADSICTLPAQALASNGSFMWDTNRRNYEEELMLTHDAYARYGLPRHQSFVMPDSLYSTEVYNPQGLSNYHQEQGRYRHAGSILIQSQSADGRQHEYYSVRRSQFSRDENRGG